MDDNDEGRGGNVEEEEPPSSPPPTHHHHRHNPRSFGTTAPTPTSSLASEAYLAVRDFFSASVAEARGDRGSAAAHAAAAASRVQTAVEAEGALARGDFGPVCDLLATAFAWKAQALSNALESSTPTETGPVCLSPGLLSAALPPPLSLAAAAHSRYHHRPARSARHHRSRLPYEDEDEEDEGLFGVPPLAAAAAANVHASAAAGGNATATNASNATANDDAQEDAALEAELVRRCMRRPAGLPADPRALPRVQGLHDVKRELEDAMLLPARLPLRLRRALHGVRRPPRTFLLHGPPGTGKTLLAEAAAAAAGACLLSASPSAVLSKWSGESERAVRLLFAAARRLAPCVVFLDEVDALGASRGGFAAGDGGGGGGRGGGVGGGGGGSGGNQDALARRVLTELLVQLSRLDAEEEEEEEGGGNGGGWSGPRQRQPRGPVWVFAATNRLCDVDPALMRRFERRVAVPLPDAEGRAAFVRAALRKLAEEEGEGADSAAGHALSEADVARVAAAMRGLSGADVRAVARRAALAPVRELGEEVRCRRAERGRASGAGEGGGGRKRGRRAEGDEGEDGDDEEEEEEDDGSLRLRPVCAADWDAALAALFGSAAAAAAVSEADGGGGGARG